VKNLLKLLVTIIIIGVGVWFWQNRNPVSRPEPKNQQNQANESIKSEVLASTSTILQLDTFYDIKANYPQFAGVDASFNKKIADLISQKIDTFKQDAKDYQEARKATAAPGEIISDNPEEPFNFILDWSQTQLNDKYISFVITMYYFSGGAHGINETYAFNYDVAAQKEISIDDFLGKSSQNLQKLSQLAEQKVVSQIQSGQASIDNFLMEMVKDGTKPTEDNYKNFNFNLSSLTIYFQQYQVAPGSQGPVTIVLSKSELEQNSMTSNYLK
jgi:hypothetical protein